MQGRARPETTIRLAPARDRLVADTRGVAALEFALVAPLMILLLLGTIELTNAYRIQAKVNLAAGQLVERVASQQTVVLGATADKTGSLIDMCAGAAMTLLPYDTTALSASIGSTTVQTSNGVIKPYLQWTDWTTDTQCPAVASHAGGLALGIDANSPSSLLTTSGVPYGQGGNAAPGYSAISVVVHYTYRNILPLFLGSTITMQAVAVARPRNNATVACIITSGNTPTSCPVNS